MLTMTDSAAKAVRMLVASERGATGGGVRLTLPKEPVQVLDATVVAGPEPNDEAIEHLGAHVYFPLRTATALHGKTLDADSRGGQRELRVRDRPDPV